MSTARGGRAARLFHCWNTLRAADRGGAAHHVSFPSQRKQAITASNGIYRGVARDEMRPRVRTC
jgi:hypothetical protein